MNIRVNKFLGVLAIAMIAGSQLFAQSAVIADLQQDMSLMRREVGQLRLEIEQLRRENAELQKKLRSVQTSTVGTDAMRVQVSGAKAEMAAQMEALKREIIESVKKDLDSMASKTNTNMQRLANAINTRPQESLPTTFSEDYPKSGITYTVQSGDSISKIARKNNSRIKWIQDANKISDPSKLQVGDEIFIPQK